jgi:succinoglycan biosynthesis transport protein ExoP
MSSIYDALKKAGTEKEKGRISIEIERSPGDEEKEPTTASRAGVNSPPAPSWRDYGNSRSQFTEEYGFRAGLQALYRRRRLILSTFLVTASALGAAFFFRGISHEAVCLVAVKKPTQLFVPQESSVASVPLLEGETYKEVVETTGFSIKVATTLSQKGLNLSAEEIGRRLRVEFREPDLLRLKARYREPSTAIAIANTACQTLVDFNRKELQEQQKAQVVTISGLLDDAGKEVAHAQADLAAYMRRENLVNVDFNSASSELSRILQLLGDQEMAKAKEQAALEAAQQQLAQLKKIASPSTNGSVVEDPAVTTLRSQLETVRVKFWEARGQFTDFHPVVKNFRDQIDVLQRELDRHIWNGHAPPNTSPEHELAIRQRITATSQEIIIRRAQIAAWSQFISDTRRTLGLVPGQKAGLDQLKFALVFAEDRYRNLSRRLEDTRISLESVKGSVSIVQMAVEPEPFDVLRPIIIAALLLFSIPFGIGLLVEYMDDSIRNPGELGRETGFPCLDTMPKSRFLRSGKAVFNGSFTAGFQPFRILRSAIRLLPGEPPRTIAIVGARRKEGRSTVVLHFARVLVEDQKRIIVIDADLRSSSLARMLRLESKAGLVEVLMGERTLDEVLQPIPLINAMFLPAMADGRSLPPNAEMLFRSPQFEQLLAKLHEKADVVLFDTSPVTQFADTLELLQYVDAAIIVTEAGKATKEDIQRGLELIRSSGARILGFVLNKASGEENVRRIAKLVWSYGTSSFGFVINKLRNGG